MNDNNKNRQQRTTGMVPVNKFCAYGERGRQKTYKQILRVSVSHQMKKLNRNNVTILLNNEILDAHFQFR